VPLASSSATVAGYQLHWTSDKYTAVSIIFITHAEKRLLVSYQSQI